MRHRLSNSVFVLFFLYAANLFAQDSLNELEDTAIKNAVKFVGPSVVRIDIIGGPQAAKGAADGPTTGVVISKDGMLLTSLFRFQEDPASVIVGFPNGERVPAQVISRNYSRKLCLLKCEPAQELIPIKLVDSGELQVGQTTIAVGRVYDSQQPNVSVGILSARKRIWDRAVQTDAKISPANFGGPLINLKGEVFGLLTPMSPSGETVEAGVEWYDSGIGFAVEIESTLSNQEMMLKGTDLRRGLIGIGFKGTNQYADAAEVSICMDGGPAAKAGLLPGDTVIEFEGRPIDRQAAFRHAIGPYYAGETAELVVDRDGVTKKMSVTLADKIGPFVRPAIGILANDHPDGGIEVVHVIDDMPAAKAGLVPGVRVTEIAGTPISDRKEFDEFMVRKVIGNDVEMTVMADESNLIKVVPVASSCDLLENLPVQNQVDNVRVVDLNVAEFENKCFAIVPDGKLENLSVMFFLYPPGRINKEAVVAEWKTACLAHNVIVVVPQSTDEKKWDKTEADFMAKALGVLKNEFDINARQVAIGGTKSGGVMAAYSCVSARETFSGLVLLDAALPAQLSEAQTSAANRLSIFIGMSTQFSSNEKNQLVIDSLKQARFPLLVQDAGPAPLNGWTDSWLSWANTLDRF